MILSIVVAQGLNRGIGKDNQLLWHLPGDLKFFKNTTTGKSIIMGRKTFDSIGKALPNRRNIVVSRSANLNLPNVEIFGNIEEAIAACKNEEEVCIVGGASIYEQVFDKVDKIYLTQVYHEFEADTFFPDLDMKKWVLEWQEPHEKDEKNAFNYTFKIFSRKK